MDVRSVISPFAYSCWHWFGYGVFAVNAIFILLALVRALLDAKAILPRHRAKWRWAADSRSCRVLVFPGAVGGARFLIRVKAAQP